jgi:hypothetical protein
MRVTIRQNSGRRPTFCLIVTRIQNGCSQRLPDCIIDCGDQIIVIEIDTICALSKLKPNALKHI